MVMFLMWCPSVVSSVAMVMFDVVFYVVSVLMVMLSLGVLVWCPVLPWQCFL